MVNGNQLTSGCFHREHSLHAYALIEHHFANFAVPESDFAFEEHESGPEILVYLAFATAGVTFAKSVIDLVIAILKARSDGVKKGDIPAEPVELIVRRVGDGDKFEEELVLRIGHNEPVDASAVARRLEATLSRREMRANYGATWNVTLLNSVPLGVVT